MTIELSYFSGGPRERILRAIVAAGHSVKKVFVNDPSRWPKVRPTIELAEQLGIPVRVVFRKGELSSLCTELRDAACFSAGFNYLFPAELLNNVKIFLNVHGSLLPKYPGARTLSWAIEKGEQESGVTVHKIDDGVDTGPILLQRSFPLSPFETTRSLARKTSEIESPVVVEALALFESMGEAAFSPQLRAADRLPNRVPQHSEVDPTLPLIDLFNKIRAADPQQYPAYFYHEGQKVCVTIWRDAKPADESDLI